MVGVEMPASMSQNYQWWWHWSDWWSCFCCCSGLSLAVTCRCCCCGCRKRCRVSLLWWSLLMLLWVERSHLCRCATTGKSAQLVVATRSCGFCGVGAIGVVVLLLLRWCRWTWAGESVGGVRPILFVSTKGRQLEMVGVGMPASMSQN